MSQTHQTQEPTLENIPTKTISFDISSEVVIMGILLAVAIWRQFISVQLVRWMHRIVSKRSYKHDLNLQHILAECVGKTNACRILLYEFHNGTKLTSGRHFQRVSVTNQYAHAGFALVKEIKDSPISVIATLLEDLDELQKADPKNQIPYIYRALNSTPDLHSQLMQAMGVSHNICFLMLDKDKELGIVEVQFDDQMSLEELQKEAREILPRIHRIAFELKQAAASKSLWITLSSEVFNRG